MAPTLEEYCHCPHCNRRTRHSVARERVLAPVLWCLSCFRMRVETVKPKAKAKAASRHAPPTGAGQTYRLAG
ncbi:hypothetical protein CCC_03498 [Paramagnetospirillum magnetotacticum MS-1]|uniref:Uncharacterized protein n=1 Tax=Paramagnetospirillum magnetotacticum MS-1 TaxID=272627 RepID=A0A0C2YX68_PARME|nr:hypothetical protein [Paramagnetospirillum magnetotacticum]KIL99280.1 hypothetical protein CCC_03498 [Paramagnetospirillum magnetotacticum MS-1]